MRFFLCQNHDIGYTIYIMVNRHLFRSIVLQTLFEWDIRGKNNLAVQDYISYNLGAFNTGAEDQKTDIIELTEAIVRKHAILDDIIEKASPDWSLLKITMIDRNILRLGLYELLFGDRTKVPAKVAINEAVDLAKEFGGNKSSRFVNGVVGAVYREIGEPGKDEKTKNKFSDITYEDMPIDKKGGAVIYAIDDNHVLRLGMVHDVFGYWTLSKGTIEEGETIEEGTIREVKEETNWDISIKHKLGENEYIAYHPERGPVRKHVGYFLAESAYTQPTLEVGTGGLDDVRWFGLDEIADLTIYDDVSKMIIKSIEVLTTEGLIAPLKTKADIQEKTPPLDKE